MYLTLNARTDAMPRPETGHGDLLSSCAWTEVGTWPAFGYQRANFGKQILARAPGIGGGT